MIYFHLGQSSEWRENEGTAKGEAVPVLRLTLSHMGFYRGLSFSCPSSPGSQ